MDANNSYRIRLTDSNKELKIPIQMKWDFMGRDESIDEYQTDVVKEVIGVPGDFEISRFSHKEFGIYNKTEINYQFYFYSGNQSSVSSSTITDWVDSYQGLGFTTKQIYYYEKPFTKSFFKLDFYDTSDTKTQTNYLTIIIPTQQGYFEKSTISSVLPTVNIRKPKYKLDFIGDKEGYFIYWLRDEQYYNLTTFYMTAKFFDARVGSFIPMINTPQSSLNGNTFTFNASNYFYVKVNLDYDNYQYEVLDLNNLRIGTTTPIKWYQYVDPS